MAYRKSIRAELTESLSAFDACLMTGPTNIMHFIGFPSLAIRMCFDYDNNSPRGMILYGADERRLIAAALTIEKYCSELPLPKLA
jgi:hypothetical protein